MMYMEGSATDRERTLILTKDDTLAYGDSWRGAAKVFTVRVQVPQSNININLSIEICIGAMSLHGRCSEQKWRFSNCTFPVASNSYSLRRGDLDENCDFQKKSIALMFEGFLFGGSWSCEIEFVKRKLYHMDVARHACSIRMQFATLATGCKRSPTLASASTRM